MKKILIAGGCSYTDENFISLAPDFKMPEKTWDMWPEYLGRKLDLKTINVGKSGNDNFSIYSSVLRSIVAYGDRVDMVVVLWSGWDRSLLFNMYSLCTVQEFNSILRERYERLPGYIKDSGISSAISTFLNSNYWDPYNFTKGSTENTLSLMYSLAQICESKNIKYIFYQGVAPICVIGGEKSVIKSTPIDPKSWFDIIRKSPFSGELEKRKKNIIGWPFLPEYFGHSLDYLRHHGKKSPFFRNKFFISELDPHPNSEAQPLISDIFYDRFKEIYS